MKKCIRCKIVFHLEERTECLYCGAKLQSVSSIDDSSDKIKVLSDEGEVEEAQGDLFRRYVEDQRSILQKQQDLINQYFRYRTFHFRYVFHRSEFKIGKKFARYFIQPINVGSVLLLPWFLVNIVESVFYHLCYNFGFCQECGWKYLMLLSPQEGHDPKRCAFNREYADLVEDIFSGKIAESEPRRKAEANNRIKSGDRTAYYVLCGPITKYQAALDVAAVWFSIGLMVYLIVWVAFPVTVSLVSILNT